MIDKAVVGGPRYWGLIIFLLAIIGIGVACYLVQFFYGLGITGMSRDVSWGFYIAQFTFLVGVAASAVMVVLPYYWHNYKAFGKITILGEFLAIPAVLMCMLFILVDLGQPMRMLNIILHPSPTSVMFWDMVSLGGYLVLNMVIGWVVLDCERKQVAPPKWIKPVIYLSIPWAVSIHTVTAFLYAGLPSRHLWLSAILAARFLASAFCAGPSLLIILCLIVRRYTKFDPGKEAIQTLAKIVAYTMCLNIFFLLLEVFTGFYSQIPGHMHPFIYLYTGLVEHGHYYGKLVPWMRISSVLAVIAILLLLIPAARKREEVLVFACASVFFSCWIDKGMGLVIGGFIPNPFETITEYTPTLPEIGITLGVWGIGFLVLTILYKIAVSVKEEIAR